MENRNLEAYNQPVQCSWCGSVVDGWEHHIDECGVSHWFCPICGDEK